MGKITDPSARIVRRFDDPEIPEVRMEIPKDIALTCNQRGQWELLIDGVKFPYVIAGDDWGPRLGPVSSTNYPTLTITLYADRIRVDHDFTA